MDTNQIVGYYMLSAFYIHITARYFTSTSICQDRTVGKGVSMLLVVQKSENLPTGAVL